MMTKSGLILQFLLVFPLAVSAQWPNCIETGTDYDGAVVVSSYRFNNRECADWCAVLGQARCARWVYKESGSICSLKSADGNAVAVTGAEALRTYAGTSTCFAPDFVGWKDCAIEAFSLTNGPHGEPAKANFNSPDINSCSFECFKDDTCTHWVYNDFAKQCTLKVNPDPTAVATANTWYGTKECVGRVNEPVSNIAPTVHGVWSPWSTMNTPCINRRSGKVVLCGGGSQVKFRSCTKPVPRYGGFICDGRSVEEFACNSHLCQLPGKYLWSEWSQPDKLCTVGTQKRTTLCGDVRPKLPSNLNKEELAVNYPSCLMPHDNNALPLESTTGKTLDECMNDCEASTTCKYYTFNFDDGECKLADILSIGSFKTMANFVTGEKLCKSELKAPYCGEYKKDYSGAPKIGTAFDVSQMDQCSKNCTSDANCENWNVVVKGSDSSMTCELRGAIPAGETAVTVAGNDTWSFFGTKACEMMPDEPVIPEMAVEFSYKEVCEDNQYQEEEKTINTWDRTKCQLPCFENGDCPRYAACVDLSDDVGPNHNCICQLGRNMVGGKCLDPPDATEKPRKRPKMSDGEKSTVMGITRMAFFFLIMFTSLTLLVFGIYRIFNQGRFIHMNIEIALLLAHLCLMPDFAQSDSQSTCRNISICIHFFYTAAFAFYVVEGIYIYSVVSYAVKANGMMSNMGNFMTGWGIAIIVIAFTVSFEYNNYGGGHDPYQCFLQVETPLIYGEFVPIVILFVIAVMLMEAGFNVDEDTMKPLEDSDADCLTSAKHMLNSFFLRVTLTFVCFSLGVIAFYTYDSMFLYILFVVSTFLLGLTIFIGHCSSDEIIRAKLMAIKHKVWKKKGATGETDTEPIIKPAGEGY